MAIGGNGHEYDITMIAGSSLKTTASQYMVVSLVAATSTTLERKVQASFVADLAAQSVSAHHAFGINQTYMSASSGDAIQVRVFGVSKAICGASVPAGAFVVPYRGASTTSRIGNIQALTNGVSCTIATTSITSHLVILGRALESGSTGTVISVFVNPQLSDTHLLAES